MVRNILGLFALRIRSLWALRADVHPTVRIERGVVLSKRVNIERDTYIGIRTIVSFSDIGPYCSIGPGSFIGLGEHDYSDISTSKKKSKTPLLHSRTVLEGDNWVGAGVVIKQGVKMGFGSLVGAGSVLTKDTLPFGIYVGSPARLLRFRFEKERIEEILSSEWWIND